MESSFLSVFLMLFIGFFVGHPVGPTPEPPYEQVACTMDAKMCPDGITYVGRVAPNCEFAECPKPAGKLPASETPTDPDDMVKDYILKNISTLSPDAPSVGGTWVVTSVSLQDDSVAVVSYEDGNTQKKISFPYQLIDNKIFPGEVTELQ